MVWVGVSCYNCTGSPQYMAILVQWCWTNGGYKLSSEFQPLQHQHSWVLECSAICLCLGLAAVPHNYVITIYKRLCQLPQKLNGERLQVAGVNLPSLTHSPQTLRTHATPAILTPSPMLTSPSLNITVDPPYLSLQPWAPLLSFASIAPLLHPHWPMPRLPCTLTHHCQLLLCLLHTLPRPCLLLHSDVLLCMFTSSPQPSPYLPHVPAFALPPSESYSPFPSLTFLIHPP